MITYVSVDTTGKLEVKQCSSNPRETLIALQKEVNGYIEAIRLRPDLVGYVNEDYMELRLTPNYFATRLLRFLGSEHAFSAGQIWGNLVLIGTSRSQEVSLTDQQIEEIKNFHSF